MRTMLIHADGTGCDHDGAGGLSPAGPVCGAGWRVGWVEAGDCRLSIEEATAAVTSVAEAFIRSLSPVFAAFAQMCAAFTSSAEVRALAAAGDILGAAHGDDGEQDAVRASMRFPHLPRGPAGDPCGSPPQQVQ